MSPGGVAVMFYLSVAALLGGTVLSARASVERKGRNHAGLALAAGGALGLLVAIVAFATGPKTALPF